MRHVRQGPPARIWHRVVVLGVALLCWAAPYAHATTVPPGFDDQQIATPLGVMDLTFTPDGRMLVVHRNGRISIRNQEGTLIKDTALDHTSKTCSTSDRGFQSIAVDPSFSTNHYVYIFYTSNKNGSCANNDPDGPVQRVSRFALGDDNVIDPLTEVVLLDNIPAMFEHQGGDTAFGKDGYLYVTIGDGACDYALDSGCYGQNDAARDQNILIGKVVRLTAPNGGIPPDNPFQGSNSARCNVTGRTFPGNVCQETYATGLRNPWKFAFDPNAAGTRFFINDVGQATWEEIDLGIKGADYGWNVREGHCALESTTDCGSPPAGMTNPIFDYNHDANNCLAIVGGAFVPAGAWRPEDDGAYLYGDLTCGKIFELTQSAEGTYSSTELVAGIGDNTTVALTFGPYGSGQALYYSTWYPAQIRRLAYVGTANRAPNAEISADPTYGDAPLTTTFDGSTSNDPDADPITYEWDFGDGSPSEYTATAMHEYAAVGTFTATLTVRDGRGGVDTATVRIDSGNNAPLPVIDEPLTTKRYRVGETIALSGHATDPEDGPLAGSAVSFTAILHHNDHTHPFLPPTPGGAAQVTTMAPEDPYSATTSYLEIQLTATDSQGLSRTVTQNLLPHTVDVTLQTQYPEYELKLFGNEVSPPYTLTSWEGWNLTVGAPDQAVNGRWFVFNSWSDGGAATHAITTPGSPTTYTASFKPLDYPRPGGGTPLRVPLVTAFAACDDPSSFHAAPLALPSCPEAEQESSLLTNTTSGRGTGYVHLTTLVGNPSTPADEADLRIRSHVGDVLQQGGGDYASDVLLKTTMRITDRANEASALQPATVSDFSFAVPMTCLPVAGAPGSGCEIDTTADALLPNLIKEGKRAVVSTFSAEVRDLGLDGDIGSSVCPPTCGSGDEKVFLRQGVFTP